MFTLQYMPEATVSVTRAEQQMLPIVSLLCTCGRHYEISIEAPFYFNNSKLPVKLPNVVNVYVLLSMNAIYHIVWVKKL